MNVVGPFLHSFGRFETGSDFEMFDGEFLHDEKLESNFLLAT